MRSTGSARLMGVLLLTLCMRARSDDFGNPDLATHASWPRQRSVGTNLVRSLLWLHADVTCVVESSQSVRSRIVAVPRICGRVSGPARW
jgi:hypothetical protein